MKWYDVAKWLLERVDSFPKNQRFIFGQRIASDALDILALLVEASYRRDKVTLLENANRSALRLLTTAGPSSSAPPSCGPGGTYCSQVPCGLDASQIKPTQGNTELASLGGELLQMAEGLRLI